MTEVLEKLVELLQLEPLGELSFRGNSENLGFRNVFGGQVLGQALMAGYKTVEGKDAHSMHGYFLRPGDHVDVYWTGKVQSGGQNSKFRTVTRLIEDAVKIIAIDQSSNEEVKKASIARTVTVAVTQLQGASLTQAQSTGRLNLSLVGQRDDALAELIEVDQKQLLGIEEAQPVAQKVEKKVCTIRMRKGGETLNMPIPCAKGS